MRRALPPLLALLVLLAALPAPAPPVMHRVQIRGVPFELEVAADPRTRERGLSGRRELPARGGMLFVFPNEAPRSFWMRDCVIDMDLLFLDRSGRLVSIHHMKVEPPRAPYEDPRAYWARLRQYPSGAPVMYAIELRSGVATALGLVRGEHIDLAGVPAARN